jgi:DNA-binding LytR/AlgR family response regulator
MTYLRWLKASNINEIKMLKVVDIDYFQADSKYTNAIYQNKTYILRISLKNLIQQLDPDNFTQISRNTIINIQKIDKIIKETYNMKLYIKQNNNPFTVSRPHQYKFKSN